MNDKSVTVACRSQDDLKENLQTPNGLKIPKALCENSVDVDSEQTRCQEVDNSDKETDKLFKEPAKAKLRFGIEAILNVKERETDHKELGVEEIRSRDNIYSYEHIDKRDARSDRYKQLDNAYMVDSVLSREEDDEDDEGLEPETKDIKDLKFDLDLARARLAYMGYTSPLTGTCLGESGAGLALQPNTFSPPFPVSGGGSGGGYPWAAVGDLRKERFSMVRRIGHPYQNRTPPKRKKPRTSFTRLQILELEKRFERQKYLASTERSALAKTLKMTDAQVKTWFQNRRTKWRRQTAEEREIERQAANRLLLSLQADPAHRKSMVMSPESVCLSHLQRWQEKRAADI